jgi:hypothetical protein
MFGSYFVSTFAPLFLKVEFGSYFVTTFAPLFLKVDFGSTFSEAPLVSKGGKDSGFPLQSFTEF